MAAADDESSRGRSEPPAPAVGDQRRPVNAGDLGYLYSIYRFYSIDDRLLYVGHSARIRQKIVELETGHPRGLPLGHEDGPKPWWREAARIELQHLPPGTTGEEARAEERRQVEAFHPVYNREHNEAFYDRERHERALDTAHFEIDVATAEHERHDGVVRPLERIALESAQTSDRLRPSGSALLRQGRRRPVVPADPGAAPDRIPRYRSSTRPGERSASGSLGGRARSLALFPEGPGSVVGLALVLAVLLFLVGWALLVSFRAAL